MMKKMIFHQKLKMTYVDILSNLERIGDHCQNIAESYMLEEENFKPDYEVDSAFNQ